MTEQPTKQVRHPGEVLLNDFIIPSKMSLQHVADQCGFRLEYLQGLTQCKFTATSDHFHKFARLFGTSQKFWFTLQREWFESKNIPVPKISQIAIATGYLNEYCQMSLRAYDPLEIPYVVQQIGPIKEHQLGLDLIENLFIGCPRDNNNEMNLGGKFGASLMNACLMSPDEAFKVARVVRSETNAETAPLKYNEALILARQLCCAVITHIVSQLDE